MSDIIRIDGLLVDEDTGEIIEGDPWRLDELQARHRDAGEQERQHAALRQLYSRMLMRQLGEIGGRYSSEYGRTHTVSPSTVAKAEAVAVRGAVALELLTLEQAETLLIEAALSLNVAVVERHIEAIADGDELLAARLRAQLVDEQPRAGYAVTRPPLHPAPEVERVQA